MNDEKSLKEQQKKKIKELKRNTEERKIELEIKELAQKEQQLGIKQKKLDSKASIEAINEDGQYGTQGEPRKALSTFLRNQNKLDISIVTILDRKAAILIRICTTIISALVVFHDFIDTNVDNGHLISTILMIGLMITLVLSILATKPFLSKMHTVVRDEIAPAYPTLEHNVFSGSQLNCSLADYEEAMSKVVRSQNLQLGNQIRASYLVSKSNGFKSKLVDWAYNAFLCSFMLVGVFYMASKFI